jgi:outer membrane protein OmpA-like peptidoglycan-associated protein
MKPFKFTLLVGFALLSCILGIQAAEVETTYPMAQIAMPELLIGVGTRATAMGGAGAVFSNDITSLYWNPAGLGHVNHMWLEMIHGSLYQDISQEFIGFGMPVAEGQVVAAGFNYFSLGNIEKTGITDDGRIINGLGLVELSMMGGNVGYALKTSSGITLGAGFKYFSENLGKWSQTAMALDLGVQYPFESGLIIAGALQNVGLSVGGYSLPMEVRLGAGRPFPIGESQRLNMVAEVELPTGAFSQYQLHVGGEYGIVDMVFLRAGYTLSDVNSMGSMSGLAAGLGLTLGGWKFGYTFAPMGTMGATHRISLAIDFNTAFLGLASEPKKKKRKKTLANPRMSFGMADGTGSVELPKRGTVSSPATGMTDDEKMMRSLVKQSLAVDVDIKGGNKDTELKEVLFTVRRGAGPKIAKWMMNITDMSDKQVNSLSGDGMPDTIKWNGKNKVGKTMKNVFELSFDLVLVDVNNDQETTSGMLERSSGGTINSSMASSANSLSPKMIVASARGQGEELDKDRKIAVIYFEQGRAEITSEASERIGTAVDSMKKFPKAKVLLEGFCDPVDEKGTALILSKNRAEAVMRYLTAYYKISVSRIIVRPKAEKQPIVRSNDERLRDKNRRVEITLQPTN